MNGTSIDVIWWITVVELPALTGLWWLVWRTRRDQDIAMDQHRRRLDASVAQAREALAAYKLEVAKTYASTSQLKDLEERLTDHLLRIESKLDSQTLTVRRHQ
ncbi:MAG: hypothetical protein RLW87_01230 [Alphaproteobacteria bacterium]|uniref:hypothetical protein n=1 Tax=Pacificispira sp. TaxID=2888761 RepID=UPI001B285592|nr:hypothetical protein [Alphaproteobacteria bacterium]MBO6861651.1 hypothetical protein [Alphaproteobacteria bacterium]